MKAPSIVIAVLLAATRLSAHGVAPGGIGALQDADGTLTGALLNYGVVTFDDDGTPLWVCEEALDDEGVPRGAVRTDDGTLVVIGAVEGLFVSHDEGCSYAPVLALDGVIVADVVRDASGRVLVATRDPRFDAIVAELDTETLSLMTVATFSRAVVERFASDGDRIAVAVTAVGAGGASLALVEEGGVRVIETPRTPALPFLDGAGQIAIAMPFDELNWALTLLNDDGTLSGEPTLRVPRRPRAFLESGDARFIIGDDGVFIDSPRGTYSSMSSIENPLCLVASEGEVLLCTTGRDHELVSLSDRGRTSSRFATARVRPRACADGTRGASVCPAIWEFLQVTQAIGREPPRDDDDEEQVACSACRVESGSGAWSFTLVVVMATRVRRRPTRRSLGQNPTWETSRSSTRCTSLARRPS